jgi:hypothetical protein
VGHLLSQFVVTEAAAVAADSEASVRARAAALLWEAGRLQSTASRAAKAVAKQQQQQGQPRAKKKKAGGGGDVRPAGAAAAAAATVRKQLASGRYDEFLRQGGGGGGWSCPVRTVAAHTVSRSCACIGSPCLRDCVHGASIGAGAQPGRGREGPHGVCVPPPPMR